jgi:intracellular sulfur oxidation DsrE/DsrF family protein
LKLLLHAPTAGALARARRNAANALRERPDVELRIIVNADAVTAALAEPDPTVDRHLVFCQNSLARAGAQPPRGAMTAPTAVFAIAEWQQQGWIYIRA